MEVDLEFVRSIKKAGGNDLKKCYQCATCSSVCTLSPAEKPFPRKEMLLAGWGQSKKLVRDPDIWLCYQCNDCSTYCPRDAKPGNVLAAIRSYIYQHYSVPSFMGKALANPKALPLLFLLPMTIIGALVMAATGGDFSFIKEDVVFAKFFPLFWIDFLFIPVTTIAAVCTLTGLWRFWNALQTPSLKTVGAGFVAGLISVVKDILTHGSFYECDENKSRGWTHLLLFYGFCGAAVTTGLVFAGLYLFDLPNPVPLGNPIKWIGNAAAVAGITGITALIVRRWTNGDKVGANGYQNWLFLIVVWLVFVTGFLAQVLRLADLAIPAYSVYYVHLVTVFFLFLYAPYSKFAHMLYRTVALVHAHSAGRGIKPRSRQ